MRANFSAEYFAFFTIFAQNPVACAELPHSCLPLDSSAFQPITPRFPSMQKRSPPHMTLTNFNFTHWQNGHVEEQIHLSDAAALYQLVQERFGLGVDDAKHGFSLAELTAVMAGFDTHPQAGK